MKIAILGAGAFGTALGGILAEKGYDIDYYDSRNSGDTLADTLVDSKAIVLAVPSKAAPYVLPKLPKEVPLIVATKGILSSEMFDEFKDYMILSGPGFADDIKAQKKTILTATDERVVEMFGTDYLSFDRTDDKRGVLMCGALKNVYAVMAGLLNLKEGTSEHGKYLKDVAIEMKSILNENGASGDTVDLVCGKGDLKITCNYPSRNYEFGQILRKNPKAEPEKTVEGISALKRIKRGEIRVPDDAIILKDLIKRSDEWA
jgi:glycerol-3-phosphate dehydrogenase (NAD(P)+)